MADLTAEEISEGKKQLSGPRIVFWIALILMILTVIGAIISFFTGLGFLDFPGGTGSTLTLLSSIGSLTLAIIWVILYWVELSAMSKGKPYAVGLGRFLLIIIMIVTFPIGTIVGAIVWKRFSHPAAQKYLNYI